jgi:ATP-dependent Clp protease ATP-binding subunit ClpB
VDLDRLTTKSSEAVHSALAIATSGGAPYVEPLHLLAALLDQPEGLPGALLTAVGSSVRVLRPQVVQTLAQQPPTPGSPVAAPQLSRPLVAVIEAAEAQAAKLGDDYVSTEHLMIGLAEGTGYCASLLQGVGATPTALLGKVETVRGGARRTTSNDPGGSYQALDKYATDLTQLARDGKLDPVIGRDTELRRLVQVLSRRTKRNAALVGEAGVGKTAIVEALALRIIADDVPASLRDRRVFSFKLGLLRGDWHRDVDTAAVVERIAEDIKAAEGQIIGVVDGLHTFADDGVADKDASRMLHVLQPMLDSDVPLIATAHGDWYRHNIERLGIARNFQPIPVEPPSVAVTIAILRGVKGVYEAHHGVEISDAALVAAATLSDRYVTARFLPDKAIDLMDEAASRVRMEIDSSPVEIDELRREVDRLKMEELALEREDDPGSIELLKALRAEKAEKEERLAPLNARWEHEKSGLNRIGELKRRLDDLRRQVDVAQRHGDLSVASKLMYAEIPVAERELALASVSESTELADCSPLMRETVGPDTVAAVIAESFPLEPRPTA